LLAGYIAENYRSFIARYQVLPPSEEVSNLRECRNDPANLYLLATQLLMKFVYSQIERRRRTATRQMVELCRIGASSADEMRERLLNYLQVSLRYTNELENLKADSSPIEWRTVIERAESPQDLAELHGASQRVLESYPTHPGLLLISAATRPIRAAVDADRSLEEVRACMKALAQDNDRLNAAFNVIEWLQSQPRLQGGLLAEGLNDQVGVFYVNQGDLRGAVQYIHRAAVRTKWLRYLIRSVERGLPLVAKGEQQ